MCGSNVLNILADIKKEGWEEEYRSLLEEIRKCNRKFIKDPYPYSSEMALDETAQEQVYFFTREFAERGDKESRKKNMKTIEVLKALRGGDQPVWFRYGNDLFAHPDLLGEVTCWYSESLNGMALLKAFEDTGDTELLIKGYPGVMSVMRNVLADGMGFGWFICTPGIFSHEPPKTFESGPGLYGFLKAAKSYVVNDDFFGLIGCGCSLELSPGKITVRPRDGLKKRVMFVAKEVDVEAVQGEIKALTLFKADDSLELEMEDSTGLVKTVQVKIKGLREGDYRVTYGNSTEKYRNLGMLELAVPIDQAGRIMIAKV